MGIEGLDDAAVVVDDHTGKLQARFEGLGAVADAQSFLRQCQRGKVNHLSSASVITGKKAREVIRTGKV